MRLFSKLPVVGMSDGDENTVFVGGLSDDNSQGSVVVFF